MVRKIEYEEDFTNLGKKDYMVELEDSIKEIKRRGEKVGGFRIVISNPKLFEEVSHG